MSYSDDTDALVEEVETLTGKLAAAQEEVVRLKSELAAHTARIGTPSTTLERDDQYFPSPMSDYQYVPSPMSMSNLCSISNEGLSIFSITNEHTLWGDG
jgi:hypothetical protein